MNDLGRTDLSWGLLVVAENVADQRCIQLGRFPFEVGRSSGRDLVIQCPHVSKLHASFYSHEQDLYLEDHGSTNGTFVNGRMLRGCQQLHVDDIVQFGTHEFRLAQIQHSCLKTMSLGRASSCSTTVEFREILKNRAIKPNYQAIVGIESGAIIGYEVLVRSLSQGLESAADLFLAASRLGLERQLSEVSRSEGMCQGRFLPDKAIRFLNTHPVEIHSPDLLASLRQLREENTDVPIVLEIHESSICDPTAMKSLARELRQLNIGLAYDDFGQGQSRILELIEAPSNYLKFDIELIRGIDRAPRTRQHLLASLVQMAKDIGIMTVAEGVETQSEVEVCAELGFDIAQGFYFSKPQPIEWIVADTANADFNCVLASRQRESSLQTIKV